ncbi:MAG TPA: (2Fe-2S) ferredoxin domain-containing protein [Clostridia bacterium]|nr:(2Fe-2S) ferredoxin domain-containing protein [Clostridia bacterium]
MCSLKELQGIKTTEKEKAASREKAGQVTLAVHMGTCGIANGARVVYNTVVNELKKRGLNNVYLTQTGCPGLCFLEPLITILEPGNKPYIYGKVTAEKMEKIVLQHLVNGQPITEWLVNLEK